MVLLPTHREQAEPIVLTKNLRSVRNRLDGRGTRPDPNRIPGTGITGVDSNILEIGIVFDS